MGIYCTLEGYMIALVLLPNAVSLLAMAVVGSARNNACPQLTMQPPGYVFAIVWPILYLMLGGAMYRARGQPYALASLVALMLALNAWWVRFGNTCEPGSALFAIVSVLLATLAVAGFVLRTDTVAAALLLPLLAWLCFATFLTLSSARLHTGSSSRGQAMAL
jgi:tryptophan-rich sensory protein